MIMVWLDVAFFKNVLYLNFVGKSRANQAVLISLQDFSPLLPYIIPSTIACSVGLGVSFSNAHLIVPQKIQMFHQAKPN
jgi:hypothetical protein